jgi:hypothetical protein
MKMDKKTRLKKLEDLFQNDEVSAKFTTREACLEWSSTVAPLLKFNALMYEKFTSNASFLAHDISLVIRRPAIDNMIDIVRMAIEELKVEIEGDQDDKQINNNRDVYMEWDVFICHASEDKETFVRPLAEALNKSDLKVWYDEFSLTLGDSLRRSIDRGLNGSQYGVVVLSQLFFEKHWPQLELDGLAQREVNGHKVILPIWHNVTREDVMRYSPTLADRVAVESNKGIDTVVEEVVRVVRGVKAEIRTVSSYKHRIPVNYQGQLAIRLGNVLEINQWFGPDGPGGSGQLRICKMNDLTDQTKYTSDIAHAMMAIVPVDVLIKGRVAGPIERSSGSTDFFFEMTDEEFMNFYADRIVQRSPLMG